MSDTYTGGKCHHCQKPSFLRFCSQRCKQMSILKATAFRERFRAETPQRMSREERKRIERERLQRDVDAFLAKGGEIVEEDQKPSPAGAAPARARSVLFS